jgi:tRNA U34 5-methylaminomethyl-2-thiouridine-forming methyltransferase MnmC
MEMGTENEEERAVGFDSKTNRMVRSDDGSCTAYSVHFGEHYHSTKDGALTESLQKHVIPALKLQREKHEITILDICFGLGFNTLATLYYLKANNIRKRVRIFSPEFDGDLVRSLRDFAYPEEFAPFTPMIRALSETGRYEDESVMIVLYIGDAREYLRHCNERFDIVYQDAFSPQVNPQLWTREYFADIARLIKNDGVLTTYSTALKTRLALHENGFNVYLNSGEGFRNATIASKGELAGFKKVDMRHKIACNPDISPLLDVEMPKR